MPKKIRVLIVDHCYVIILKTFKNQTLIRKTWKPSQNRSQTNSNPHVSYKSIISLFLLWARSNQKIYGTGPWNESNKYKLKASLNAQDGTQHEQSKNT